MSAFRLCCTLASILGCCVGYTVIQRPVEYYEYMKTPSEYQWQPLEYQFQPSDYQNPPYDYQSHGYQPYDYRPYEYRPVYSSYYYYYYPLYGPPASYNYDTKPTLPHAEAQRFLQVYRVIRVIVLFRDPILKPLTSFDVLIVELTKDTLQNQLVELLSDIEGYEEVAELSNDPSVQLNNSFVNDPERLLLAIQRALNALDLTADLDMDLLEKLRNLRNLANALTVELIAAELVQLSQSHAKEALVTDVLENLLGHVESKDLKEFHDNFEVKVEGDNLENVEKYVILIDDPLAKEEQEPKAELSDVSLDDLAVALEMFLEEQKIAESNLAKEKSIAGHEQVVESVTIAASTTTTQESLSTNTTKEPTNSWLGSLLGKGHLLTGHYGSSNEVSESQKLPQPIDVSQPAVLVESTQPDANTMDTQNLWVNAENEEGKEVLDFDIDQRFQSLPPANVPVTHSVPLWLLQNTKDQKVENKQLDLEEVLEDRNEALDELQRQLQEPMIDEEQIELEDIIEGRTEDTLAELTENNEFEAEQDRIGDALAEAISEFSEDEEKLQTIDDEGPARFDLPVDLSESDSPSSELAPNGEQRELHRPVVTTESSTSSADPTVDLITESIPIESKESQTATTEPDARRFIREEVLKVLSLLEESNGFAELKEHITEQDLNGIVDELSQVHVAIRWAEMISALQKMVLSKDFESGSQMMDILEHWKTGEEGHLDDGYFDRTYGSNELAESRLLQEEIEEADMEQMQLAQLQAAVMESRDLDDEQSAETVTNPVIFIDDEDNYFEAIGNSTQNETSIVTEDATLEVPVESRNARILNTDDVPNELENSTTDSQVADEVSTSERLQDDEVTEKLEVTTSQPFPADEA